MTAEDLLVTGALEVEGVLTDASNLTARVLISDADGAPTGERALYKPFRGEAPLRDFPDGTLGRREVAAFLVSAAGGWDLIPLTVLRDGPFGPGSVQRWVDWEAAGVQPGDGLLEMFPARAVPDGWLPVVHGEDAEGTPIVVAHRDEPDLASLAVLDLVLNNADRKGAHLVRDAAGHLWGFDHGLTLHTDDKLRTVLWGWAGQPLPHRDVAHLESLHKHLAAVGRREPADMTQDVSVQAVAEHPVTERNVSAPAVHAHTISRLISPEEFVALTDRVERLLTQPMFPDLPTDRYPLPWPLW